MLVASGEYSKADEGFRYSFEADGDTRTAEDVSLRLRWDPETSSSTSKLGFLLVDQWNFDPDDSDDSGDYLHGTYVASRLQLGDDEEDLFFDALVSAGRYEGFNISGISTGLAGVFQTRYGFPSTNARSFAALAEFSITQEDYIRLEDVTERKDFDDPFADSGWAAFALGGEVRTGSLSFSLLGVVERVFEGSNDGREKYGADFSLSYYEEERAPAGQAAFWLPTSSYVTLEFREYDFEPGTGFRDDQNTSINLGANWDFGATQIDLRYEDYFYDTANRDLGFDDSDGSALEVGIGHYGDPWSFYFYGYASEDDAVSDFEDSDTRDLDMSLSISYDPTVFPEITTTFRYYEYKGDFSGTSFESNERSVAVGIDVLEFFKKPKNSKAELDLSLKFVRERTRDEFSTSRWETDDDFVLGFKFSISG